MNQSATIQRLTNHLRRIESEIMAIRQELNALPEQQNLRPSSDVTISYNWASKTELRKQMQQLFLTWSIQDNPIGIESLQKQMRETNLAANELSQSIISTREE